MAYYAVKNGRLKGIYQTWNEVSPLVNGFSNAVHKKFKTESEARAYMGNASTSNQSGGSLAVRSHSTTTKAPATIPFHTGLAFEVGRPSTTARAPQPTRKSIAPSIPFCSGLAYEVKSHAAPSKAPQPTQKSNRPSDTSPYYHTLLPANSDSVSSILKKLTCHTSLKNQESLEPKTSQYLIFCDGASRNNGAAGAVSGYGVYIPEDNLGYSIAYKDVPKSIVGEARPTNQTCEMLAMRHSLIKAKDRVTRDASSEIFIATDSKYTIKSVNEWGQLWEKNNWKTSTGAPVVHLKIAKECMTLKSDIEGVTKKPINFLHVPGHSGILGNEVADKLANIACDRSAVPAKVRRK